MLLRALGGDGGDAEDWKRKGVSNCNQVSPDGLLTVDSGAVNANVDGNEVDGLLDDLVAAGCRLALCALVLGFLAGSLLLGALLNVVCWDSSCHEGKGDGGDDAGELHFG